MTNANETNWYAGVFKSWQVKQLGPKPTADQLAAVHHLNARPGKQALAIAMGLRDCGVTGSQIIMACGAPQLNKMRGYITDALLKRLPVPPSAVGHQVYKLELTAKGKQAIERTKARLAKVELEGAAKGTAEKPAKAAAKAKGTVKKPRTVKAKAAETVPSEPVNEPLTPTVNEMLAAIQPV